MEIKISKKISKLNQSKTSKIFDKTNLLISQGENIINLSAGEPDFTLSDAERAKWILNQAGINKYYLKFVLIIVKLYINNINY